VNDGGTARSELLARHGDELERRLDEAQARLAADGPGAACRAVGHSLKGSALMLGLDGLAVAAAALEAACDTAGGGDAAAATRALALARDEIRRVRDHPRRIAHDLRGALNVVVGYASILENDPLVASHGDAVREILAAAARLGTTIDRLDGARHSALPTPMAGLPGSGSVLVVDDDPVAGRLLADLIEANGASAVLVEDGDDALRCLAGVLPDLVILDLALGRSDGRELLRKIRAAPSLVGLPVVVSSGDGSAAVATELEAAGATAFLPKPVDRGSLATLLARHCG
jgi:CheY-like chemotaxis protein/HPt (histidine-containing phosphotransfer) domain-containing protein